MTDSNRIRICSFFIRCYCLLTICDKVSVLGIPQSHFDIDKIFADAFGNKTGTNIDFPSFSSASSIFAKPLSMDSDGDDNSTTVVRTGNWTTLKKTVVTKDGQVVYQSENSNKGSTDGGSPTSEIGNGDDPFKNFNFNDFVNRNIGGSGSKKPEEPTEQPIQETSPIAKTKPIILTGNNYPPPSPVPISSNSPIRNSPSEECEKSITTVNGVPACKGHLIFESNFENNIDKYWTNEVHFNKDESEFVVFDDLPINVYCKSDYLNIQPTLLDDYYGEKYTVSLPLDLTAKCTTRNEQLCKREKFVSTILPPIMSARLTTKESFSFKYGVVEVSARLPRGDWVIPEIWLHPKAYKPYGAKNSGRVILAKSIGNENLHHGGLPIGNNILTAGLEVNDKSRRFRKKTNDGLWSDDFHVYRLDWTPHGMKFSVDGDTIGEWFGNGNSPLLQETGFSQRYGPVSPFDQEFYLLLGVHVGGYLDIPDDAVSGDHDKPWKNSNPKRMILFHQDLKNWYKTWNDDTRLQVEHIKVWAS